MEHDIRDHWKNKTHFTGYCKLICFSSDFASPANVSIVLGGKEHITATSYTWTVETRQVTLSVTDDCVPVGESVTGTIQGGEVISDVSILKAKLNLNISDSDITLDLLFCCFNNRFKLKSNSQTVQMLWRISKI